MNFNVTFAVCRKTNLGEGISFTSWPLLVIYSTDCVFYPDTLTTVNRHIEIMASVRIQPPKLGQAVLIPQKVLHTSHRFGLMFTFGFNYSSFSKISAWNATVKEKSRISVYEWKYMK